MAMTPANAGQPSMNQTRNRRRGLEKIEPREPAVLDGRWAPTQDLREAHRLDAGCRAPGSRIAQRRGRQLGERGRARRAAPAEMSERVGTHDDQARQECRQLPDRLGREAKPAALLGDDVPERDRLGMDQLENVANVHARAQRPRNGLGHVLDAHELEPAVCCDQRRPPRHAGEPAQHRGRAVDAGRQDHAGTQDQPVEIARRKLRIGDGLAGRELGRAVVADTQRRHVNDAPWSAGRAGGEQRERPGDVDALQVVARAGLERADTVHDRVDAGQQRLPVFLAIETVEIRFDPLRIAKAPARHRDRASGADEIMTVAVQARQDRRADQAISAGDENTHVFTRRTPTADDRQSSGACSRVSGRQRGTGRRANSPWQTRPWRRRW